MIQAIKQKIINITGWTQNEAHFYCSGILLLVFAVVAYMAGCTIGWSAFVGFGVATAVNIIIETLDYRDKGFVEKNDIFYDFCGQVAGGTLFIAAASVLGEIL